MSTPCEITSSSRCRFGIARCNITPPVGMYHRMWGAALQDQSTGIHRALTGTAMAFSDLAEEAETAPVVVIMIDHCLLRIPDLQLLLEDVSRLSHIPQENILLTFSHTHSGGYLSRDRAHLPGGDLVGPYLDELPGKLAMIALTALASSQPASLTYAKINCPLGRHRDFYDTASRQYVCGLNPTGVIDDTLWVTRVCDDEQQVLGTIVNYGCHPTTLAWQNSLISPDYIGMVRELLETEMNAPCAFLLSACGDVGAAEQYTDDVNLADRHGKQLGYAALSALYSLPAPLHDLHYQGAVISGATLGVWKAQPQTRERQQIVQHFRQSHFFIDLPYRSDLTTLADAETGFAEWVEREKEALASGNELVARDARAMCERYRRMLDRLRPLPQGETYPYPVWMWRLGDAIWVAVEGEPYNELQARLRQRFPDRPIIVIVLANGSRSWYLPTREAYSKKLYQVDVALLAPGCLETVCEVLERRIAEWI